MNTVLLTARLKLREPKEIDAEILQTYFARNAERFGVWGDGLASVDADRCLDWIAWRGAQSASGQGRSFLAFFSGSTLAGIVELDAISPGPPRVGMLAYSIDEEFEGRGIAGEAVAAVVRHAFQDLRLNTLLAYHHPDNARSESLLRRAGFETQAVDANIPPEVRALMRPQAMAILNASAWLAAQESS